MNLELKVFRENNLSYSWATVYVGKKLGLLNSKEVEKYALEYLENNPKCTDPYIAKLAFGQFDFEDGKITYDEFHVDFSRPFSEQLYSLKEDLFQVKYTNGDIFTIDIGWYPEMEINGSFIIYIIKNFNWEKPLFKKKSKKRNKLVQDLKSAIEVVEKIKKNKIKSR